MSSIATPKQPTPDNSDKKLRLIFAGTPEFAAVALQALIDVPNFNVCAVYTQPDRPAGRGRKLLASPVKTLALANELPVLQPPSLKNADAQAELQALQADVMVVAAYGLLLPSTVLETPRLGCLNIHASLLPRWRGAAPVERAIMAGDTETGVSIMQMDEGLDTGPVFSMLSCAIAVDETSASLREKLATLGGEAIVEVLRQLASGAISAVTDASTQDDSQANYASKIDKQELAVDWSRPAAELERMARAVAPMYTLYSLLNGQRIKLALPYCETHTAEVTAGTVIACDKKGLLVATGQGALRFPALQMEGKKMQPVHAILNAYADVFVKGTQFSDSTAI